MKKFLVHILLYAFPVFVAVSLLCGPGIYSGEFGNIDAAIQAQRNDHSILIGYGYNEQTAYYKWQNANYYQADIIALGTSRAMQFKKTYFSGEFYNCGGGVAGNYDEYRNFLENLSYEPNIMILDLDTWVFNHEWNWSCYTYDTFIPILKTDRKLQSMIKAMLEDWLDGAWTWRDLKRKYPNNIGFNGKVRDAGFMYDGSYYYGNEYRNPECQEDYMFIDTKKRIASGYGRFEYGEHIDPETIKRLQELLLYCSEHNIYVVGYTAPFAPSIYEQMQTSGQYHYLDEIAPACKKIFDSYGFEFYDYADGSTLGVTDNYFLDGFHGSEVTYAYIIQDMVAHDSKIARYVNDEKLNSLLEHTYNALVFEDPDHRTYE